MIQKEAIEKNLISMACEIEKLRREQMRTRGLELYAMMSISACMNDKDSVGLISIAEHAHEYSKEDPIRVLYHVFGYYDALHIPLVKTDLGPDFRIISDQLVIAKESGRRLGIGTNMYPSSSLLGGHNDAAIVDT
ncbi:hypothetical protein Tco_1187674 [Tanacetum coccineum]